MPLPAKKPPKQPLVSTRPCSNSEKKPLKRPALKTAIKGKAPGPAKKPEKTAKPKAGYELYSDDSEYRGDGFDVGAYGGLDHIKTLIGEAENASLTGSTSGPEINFRIERHHIGNMEKATPFNRRLVSSTPDPERLNDNDIGVPEEPVQEIKGENASGMLTDAERQAVRQYIDRELVADALAGNKRMKDEAAKLLNAQKKQPARSSAVSSGDGPVAKRRGVTSQEPHKVCDMRPLVKNKDVPSSRPHHDKKTVVVNMPDQQYVERSKELPSVSAVSSFSKRVDRHAARGSDIGAFEHFLHRESANLPSTFAQATVVPPSFAQATVVPPSFAQATVVPPSFAQASTHPGFNTESLPSKYVADVSMGFVPHSKENIPPNYPPGLSAPASRPPKIVADDRGSNHADAPVSSLPVRSIEKPQEPVESMASSDSFAQCAPPGLQWGRWGMTAQMLQKMSTNNVSGSDQRSSELPNSGPRAGAKTGLFTSGGHFINQEVLKSQEADDEITPRSYQPVPFPSPAIQPVMDRRNHVTFSTHFNQNNSNTSLLQTDQGIWSNNLPRPQQMLQASRQTQSQGEAVAGPSATTLSDDSSSDLDFDMQDSFLKMNASKPPSGALSQGITQLHFIIDQLKQCSDSQDNMNVRQLVELLGHCVSKLPQLQKNFSLDAIIEPYEAKNQQLKRRNCQLNNMLRRHELVEKSRARGFNIAEVLNAEVEKTKLMDMIKVLKINHQREKAELEDRLQAAKDTRCKDCEALLQHQKTLQLELKQKDHEALVRDQEKGHHIAGQTHELEKCHMRIQSLQSQLTTVDRENSVLGSMLKQKELQISGLQDHLGKMRQASHELLDRLGRETETSHILLLPCCKILKELAQTSYFSRTDYDMVATKGPSHQLDMSGNQRTGRVATTGQNENHASVSHRTNQLPVADENGLNTASATLSARPKTAGTSQTRWPLLSEQIFPAGDMLSKPEAPYSSRKEPIAMKDPGKANAATGGLTMEALAAHNKKMGSKPSKGEHGSVHSWTGGKKAEAADKFNKQYCSDSEMAADRDEGVSSLGRLRLIQQWSQEVESVMQLTTDSEPDQSLKEIACEINAPRGKKPCDQSGVMSETVASTLSEIPIFVLSEVPISNGMPAAHVENGSTCSLSQIPLSEANFGDSTKSAKSAAPGNTQGVSSAASLSQYTTCPSEMKDTESKSPNLAESGSFASRHASSPPPSPRKANEQEKGAQGMETKPKNAPSVLSPNSSSITLNMTGNVSSQPTQRDYFQGTELDMSMSTIPEDCGASTMTGISVFTIKSVDNAQFTSQMNDLDTRIAKAQEKLKLVKQQYS